MHLSQSKEFKHYQLSQNIYNYIQCNVIQVITNDHRHHLEFEKDITGPHLRKACIYQEGNLYWFPNQTKCTLMQWIKQNKQINNEQIKKIQIQLLAALYQLHQRKLLGRCFDAHNISFDNEKVELNNFGFYLDLKQQPPEYVVNGCYDHSIDMWLMGSLTYHLYTGFELPSLQTMKDFSQLEVHLKHCQKTETGRMIIRMLNNDPKERLTFTELINYLDIKDQAMIQFYQTDFHFTQIVGSMRNRDFKQLLSFSELSCGDGVSTDYKVPEEDDSCLSQKSIPRINPFYWRPFHRYGSEPIESRNDESYRRSRRHKTSGDEIEVSQFDVGQMGKGRIDQLLKEQQQIVQPVQVVQALEPQSVEVVQALEPEQPVEVEQAPEPQPVQVVQAPEPEPIQSLQAVLTENNENPLEPTFLCTRNRDTEESLEYQSIWEELHFLIYRFDFLQTCHDTMQHLKSNFYVSLARFMVAKMKVILVQEFIKGLTGKQNILGVKQEQWDQFIKKSQSVKQVIRDLKMLKFSDNQQLIEAHEHIEELVCLGLNAAENGIYQQVISSVTDNVSEAGFDDIKKSYRLALRQIYETCDEVVANTINFNYYAKLKFQTICCMLINRVLTKDRELCFELAKTQLNIKKITSPVQFEQFMKESCVDELQKQNKRIYDIYFSNQS